jgi:hypothetical protein
MSNIKQYHSSRKFLKRKRVVKLNVTSSSSLFVTRIVSVQLCTVYHAILIISIPYSTIQNAFTECANGYSQANFFPSLRRTFLQGIKSKSKISKYPKDEVMISFLICHKSKSKINGFIKRYLYHRNKKMSAKQTHHSFTSGYIRELGAFPFSDL